MCRILRRNMIKDLTNKSNEFTDYCVLIFNKKYCADDFNSAEKRGRKKIINLRLLRSHLICNIISFFFIFRNSKNSIEYFFFFWLDCLCNQTIDEIYNIYGGTDAYNNRQHKRKKTNSLDINSQPYACN